MNVEARFTPFEYLRFLKSVNKSRNCSTLSVSSGNLNTHTPGRTVRFKPFTIQSCLSVSNTYDAYLGAKLISSPYNTTEKSPFSRSYISAETLSCEPIASSRLAIEE